MNFTATRPGAVVAVTTAANQRVDLAAVLNLDANQVASAPDALLDNRGGVDAYILFGGPDVSVTVGTGIRVPAGAMPLFGKGSATHMAVIGAGATSLGVHLGQGV